MPKDVDISKAELRTLMQIAERTTVLNIVDKWIKKSSAPSYIKLIRKK